MLVLFNLFISKGHSWGWSSSLSLLVLCGAVIALMCFVVTGRRKGDAALIDFALFKTGPIAPRYSQISCSTAALAP